jgi:hypothetical protein
VVEGEGEKTGSAAVARGAARGGARGGERRRRGVGGAHNISAVCVVQGRGRGVGRGGAGCGGGVTVLEVRWTSALICQGFFVSKIVVKAFL